MGVPFIIFANKIIMDVLKITTNRRRNIISYLSKRLNITVYA